MNLEDHCHSHPYLASTGLFFFSIPGSLHREEGSVPRPEQLKNLKENRLKPGTQTPKSVSKGSFSEARDNSSMDRNKHSRHYHVLKQSQVPIQRLYP